MKALIIGLALNLSFLCGYSADNEAFKSKVFYWEKAKVVHEKSGENRLFYNGFTNNLTYLDVHATTLNPGKASPKADIQTKFEKLLIVKEGVILLTLNGQRKELNAGSVLLAMAGDNLKIENSGIKPAVYFMIQWDNKGLKKMERPEDLEKSEIMLWDDVPFKTTEKGGTRQFFKRPTTSLLEFEMHVTTLKEGIKSHDPHVHPADEIILIKTGNVEELINGIPYQFGPGSFVLLNGNEPHGIRNIGQGACEYFAFRFLKE